MERREKRHYWKSTLENTEMCCEKPTRVSEAKSKKL
jgi:hypothetical protein